MKYFNAMRDLNRMVRKKLKGGYPEGELREDLLQNGYSAPEIEAAISEASQGKFPNQQKELPAWYLISGGFLILGISLRAVKGLWLEPFSWPLIIIGTLGILLRLIFKK